MADTRHVENLNVSHEDSVGLKMFVLQMRKIYGSNLTVYQCKVHDYLEMYLGLSDDGVAKISMIKVSEEEDIRIAAKEINQKVKDFQKSYSAKDKQDYLAMCALMYGVESIANKKISASIDREIDDEITKFEDFLKKF